jgi:hypothetical protein
MSTTPIEIGSRKQLFIDRRFIADSVNVELVMNPAQIREEPVLVADRLWEASIAAYNTVVREADRFRMWYDFIPPENDPSGITRGVAYAESRDGVYWDKPEIGLVEIGGSKANNVVIPRLPDAPRGETEGGTVLLDMNPDCRPGERYKFWTKVRGIPEEDQARGMIGQFWQMYSEDGIYWNVYPKDTEIVPCDTQNVPLWDDRLGKYVGYGRTRNEMNGFRVRGVGRTESDDFRSWSDMVEVFRADKSDWRAVPPAECRDRLGGYVDVYTNAAMKYPYAQDAYFMMPSFLYHWECVEAVEGDGDEAADVHVNFPDTADVRLLTSRDGVSWSQAPGRKPFLPVGLAGGPRSRQMYTSPGVVRVGDLLWNYCYGNNIDHSGQVDPGSDGRDEGIFINESRLDGFMSADTPYAGGWLFTPPIVFEGSRLELNIDTGAGGLATVEIQSADGGPIDGFTRQDCRTLNGNSARMPVRFDGGAELGSLAGEPVRLRIETYDSKLYAFQFA